MVAPAPTKSDCHRANGVPNAAHKKCPQTWAEMSTLRSAVQKPAPTPKGTDATRKTTARVRLIHKCYRPSVRCHPIEGVDGGWLVELPVRQLAKSRGERSLRAERAK